MRIWLACFVVLFAIAELYEWAKHLTLPLPVYVLGGAFLALVSNYNKLAVWLGWQPNTSCEAEIDSTTDSSNRVNVKLQPPPHSIPVTIRQTGKLPE